MSTSVDNQSLRYFLDLARDAAAEAASGLKDALEYLERVDRLFMDFIPSGGALRPPTAGVLILNAHAAFRAGVGLALSGQMLPVFMCLRGALESALYANAMVADRALEDIWMQRDRNQEARRRCRKVFAIDKVIGHLATAHDRTFADSVMEAYQSTIDFGAHPNSRSVLRSVHVEDFPSGEKGLTYTYLHGAQSGQVAQALVACAEIGILVFFVALIACPPGHNVAELNERALRIQSESAHLVSVLGLAWPDGAGAAQPERPEQ